MSAFVYVIFDPAFTTKQLFEQTQIDLFQMMRKLSLMGFKQ